MNLTELYNRYYSNLQSSLQKIIVQSGDISSPVATASKSTRWLSGFGYHYRKSQCGEHYNQSMQSVLRAVCEGASSAG